MMLNIFMLFVHTYFFRVKTISSQTISISYATKIYAETK